MNKKSKKHITRFLSFILMLAMLFGEFNMYSLAAEYGDSSTIKEITKSNIEETLLSDESSILKEGLEQKAESTADELSAEEYAIWKENYLQRKQSHYIGLMSNDFDNETYTVGNYLRNKIIETYVDQNGQFTIGTVNGSSMPTDNGKKLLYGHPSPWSSFSTVKIDGISHEFNGRRDRIQTDECIMISDERDNIVTTQSLTIVENEYTGQKDTIAITYTMTNFDDVEHEVGLRIMLDTMLGNNDGSPFRVPGYGNVTTELELTGADITQSWMTFDSLENPNVIANGCLYRTLDEKPDKVQFAAWGGINSTLWDYRIDNNRKVTGDSAVGIYYDPEILKPGESRSVTTYYGIGDFAVSDAKPPLSTRISAPEELKADEKGGGYTHNPFSVTAYIQNNGNGPAINTKAVLKLPEDGTLQLISPTEYEQNIGDIEEGKDAQATWLVYANEQDVKKEVKYDVTVMADNESEKTVTITTLLNETKKENENFTIILNKNELELDADGKYYEQLEAKCSDNIKRKITWLSANPSIAVVDENGYVKTITGGQTKIIASCGSKNAVCEVTVKGTSNPLEKLELSNINLEMKVGQFKQLVERYTPTNVSQKGVVWTSSDENVIKVNDNGRLEGIAVGTATVKATYNADRSKYAVCTVKVTNDIINMAINQSIKFNEMLYGPQISLLGKDFNLFKIPMSTEIKINEMFSLSYDEEDKSLTGTFGLLGDGTLTDKGEYERDYKKIKKAAKLLEDNGPEKFLKKYSKQLSKRSNAPVYFQKGQISTFGYVKYQQANGEYKFAEGKLYLVVDFPEIFRIRYNLPACPVVYFQFNISGNVHAGLKLEAEKLGFGNGQTMKVDGEINGNLSLAGGVGADILIAGLEGGIEGTLSLNFEHLLNFVAQQDFSAELSASIYAKARALFFLEFNESWKFASVKLYPRVSNDGLYMSSMHRVTKNVLSLENDNFEPMQVNIDRLDVSEITEDNEIYDFENRGYAYNEAKMVNLSDGRIFAVWTDNVEEREEFDRTAIYYSIYENGSWKESKLVDDDGTADFSPKIATDGEKVYIAWQNMDRVIGMESSLEDMLPFTGIKMACYDAGEIKDVRNITLENDSYDSAPEIACSDNGVSVVWCNNLSNDWTLYEGINIVKEYTYSSKKNEEVSANNIYTAENVITSMDVEFNKDDVMVVISEDTDDDFNTIENIKLYKNGVSENEISSKVKGRQVLFNKDDSGLSLYWWDGNGIRRMKDFNYNLIETCMASTSSVNYKVMENGTIYWVETDGEESRLNAVIKGQKEWYSPVTLYEFNGVIRDPEVTVMNDGSMKIMTNLVTLRESNDDMEAALVSIDVDSHTDLEILNVPYLNEMELEAGKEVTINVDVVNSGTVPVSSVKVKLIDENGYVLAEETVNEVINPGTTKTYTMSYSLPSPMRYHNVIVQAIPTNVADIDLMNNESVLWIGESDLLVSDVKISGYGETRKVYIEVSNIGYKMSDEVEVIVTSDSLQGEVLGYSVIGEVEGRRRKNTSVIIELEDLYFDDEAGKIVYVQLKEGERYLGEGAMMSQIIANPKDEGTISLASGVYDNKRINLNLYNNVDRQVSGNMMIDLIENDDVIFSCSQLINLEPYDNMTAEFDIRSLLVYPHDRIAVYIVDNEGKFLSNRIYHNSQQVALGDIDIKLDKEQIILRAGDQQKINVGLTDDAWELADIVWSTSDKEIADVDMNGNITGISEGVAIISAENKILKMKSECKVIVVGNSPLEDYMDVFLKTDSVTIDLAQNRGEYISFLMLFKQNAADYMLTSLNSNQEEYSSVVIEDIILENEELKEIFELCLVDDGRAVLRPLKDLKDHVSFSNKTYQSDISLKLRGSNEKINLGSIDIKTKFTLPKLTANGVKLEIYDENSSAEIIFKNKGKEVRDVISVSVNTVSDKKKNTYPVYFTYDNEENLLRIDEKYYEQIEKGNYIADLSVLLDGYTTPSSVNLKVEVKEERPNITLESEDIYLRAVPNERYAYLPILLPDTMKNKVLEKVSLKGDDSGIFEIMAGNDNRELLIRNKIIISGAENYEISLKYRGLSKEILIPVTIRAITNEIEYRIARNSIKINRLAQVENYEKIKISGAADNDPVSIEKYSEVIGREEKELKNVGFTFDSEKGILTVIPGSKKGTFNVKIYPSGSRDPLDLKIKVYNEYPSFTVSRSRVELNTQTRETEIIHLSNKEGYSNNFRYSIKDKNNRSASVGSVVTGDGYIAITPYESVKKGNYKLIITPTQGGDKSIKIKLRVTDSAPKFTISSKKVNMNANIPYTAEQAVLSVKTKPAGHETENFVFYQLDSKGKKHSVTDFTIVKGSDGKIYISRISDAVKPGTYNIVAESQNFRKAKALKFKIVVTDDVLTFTQKGTTILNKNIINQGERSKINLITKNNIVDYGDFTFLQKKGNQLEKLEGINIVKGDDGYYATLSGNSIQKAGTINLVARSESFGNVKDVNIKVRIIDKTASMKAKFNTKLDLADKSSYAEVQLSMINNNIPLTQDGKLSIDNANFELYNFRPEENTIRLRLSENADISDKNSKTLIFTYEDNNGNVITSGKTVVPVTSSKVGIKTDKTSYVMYKCDKTEEAVIKLLANNNINAVLEEVSLTESSDFSIRTISKTTRKYAIDIVDEDKVKIGKHILKLNVKVRGIEKPFEVKVNIDVR